MGMMLNRIREVDQALEALFDKRRDVAAGATNGTRGSVTDLSEIQSELRRLRTMVEQPSTGIEELL